MPSVRVAISPVCNSRRPQAKLLAQPAATAPKSAPGTPSESGGTMTMVFKSGEKAFHASAWEFMRKEMGVPEKNLVVSIIDGDDEARAIAAE